MNILVTVDSNYIRPLKVMLTSFFTYHKNQNKIYLLHSNVKSTELEELAALVKEHGSRFFPVRMEEDILSDLPVLRYFTREMYYRLFAGRKLPEEKRILYLDPDILIRGSLENMYETDLEGNVLAGIEDFAVKTLLLEHKRELGFEEEEKYINSGVLLIDLDRLRDTFREEELYRIAREKKEFLQYPDQDLINLMFRGKIKVLERCFNYNSGYGSVKEMLRYIAGGFLKERKYPVIVHYMGQSKPWHPDYYGKFGKEYRRYLKKYPDPDTRKEWKRRHLAVMKHLSMVVVRKAGGKSNGKI